MEERTLDTGHRTPTRLLTATEAAALCNVHHRTIRRAIERGDLPATKFGGVFRIDPDDLRAWQVSRRAESHWRPLVTHADLGMQMRQVMPQPITSFIGREREVADIVSLLRRDDIRLLTLAGLGGVGKTRLALQAIAALQEEDAFRDGIWFVELAPLDAPEQMLPALARAVGVHATGGRTPLSSLLAHFHDRKALLVLDNFEHLLAAAPGLATLMESSANIKVLTTSRVLLRVTGEQSFPVPPLTLPDRQSSLKTMGITDAMRLFTERAGRVQPGFELTERNFPVVAEICRCLDGLPLAIELAAARCNFLGPAALLARLDDQLGILIGGPRDVPARLRSMRDAIGWSYNLLSSSEQVLIRRMSVFAGGCTTEAISTVCAPTVDHKRELLAMLSKLVDSSLIQSDEWQTGEPRFTMLETIRAYGLQQLESSGDVEQVRSAHAAYFLALAERMAMAMTGPTVHDATASLSAERSNCWIALAWFESRGDNAALRRMTEALQDYWVISGDWTEGVQWLERSSELEEPNSPGRVRALSRIGLMQTTLGDIAQAESVLQEALRLSHQGVPGQVRCEALFNLAWLRARQGAFHGVELCAAEARSLAQEAGDLKGERTSHHWSGVAALGMRDRDTARAHFERSEEIQEQLGEPPDLRTRHLVMLEAGDGDFALAAEGLRQIVETTPLANRNLALLLDDFASLAAMIGETARAARLFGSCQHITETISLDKFWVDSERVKAAFASTQKALGPKAFSTELERGRGLSRDELTFEMEAVLMSAVQAGNLGHPLRRVHNDHGLTIREQEVLQLVAERYSNPEIADRLCVGTRTVQTHVAHIFQKLGVNNRREAADVAYRLGLK